MRQSLWLSNSLLLHRANVFPIVFTWVWGWGVHAPGMPGTFFLPPTSGKPLVSDPGMHCGTCVTHVPWCMSGSLTHGSGNNVPAIPGVCATRNFMYLARGSCYKIGRYSRQTRNDCLYVTSGPCNLERLTEIIASIIFCCVYSSIS